MATPEFSCIAMRQVSIGQMIHWIRVQMPYHVSDDKRMLHAIAQGLFASQYDDFRSIDRDNAILREKTYDCSRCHSQVPAEFLLIDDTDEQIVKCAFLCPSCLTSTTVEIPLIAEASNVEG